VFFAALGKNTQLMVATEYAYYLLGVAERFQTMERTMQIENENTFRAAIGKQVNLFLGAGFSTLAQDNEGNDLPLGGELAKELRAAFELEELVSVDLPQLCTIISASRADELRQFLVDRFTVGSFSTKYKALCRLDISTIFTTNIDNLIHSIFADSKRYYINDANVNGPVYKDRFVGTSSQKEHV
jgi:hypothetical protein